MTDSLTQNQIAMHLDLDQSRVSVLCAEMSIDWKNSSIDEIRYAYIRRLREQAAGRFSGEGLDLATERALLAREQRIKIEMQNEVSRREMAPVTLIEEVLAKVGRQIAGILESIPVQLKRRSSLTADDLEYITGEIVKARNLAAAIKLNELDIEFSDDGDTADA
jgi:phage terminase Nu1 subunit (DNA packaging protein)